MLNSLLLTFYLSYTMRVLLIHSDLLEFEAKQKALKSAPDISEKTGRAENALVCFMAGEKSDEANPEAVVKKVVADI